MVWKSCIATFVFLIVFLFCKTLLIYPGHWAVYTSFSLTFLVLLILGFYPDKSFFDTFIGVLFWLGFWLKFSYRMAFMHGHFKDPVGAFLASPESYDRVLLISSIGALGLIVAHFVRVKLIFSYTRLSPCFSLNYMATSYKKHKNIFYFFFVLIFSVLSFCNIYYGFYQRGQPPRTTLPQPLRGVCTWLLLFGLTSFSAVALNFELKDNRSPYLLTVIALMESFLTNLSMLSRGFVVNIGALVVGEHRTIKKKFLPVKFFYKVNMLILFGGLFFVSILMVNYIRNYAYFDRQIYTTNANENFEFKPMQKNDMNWIAIHTTDLFIDRWVGIEGVMAISSFKNLGWNLWQQAWSENFSDSEMSFYDRQMAGASPYLGVDFNKHHFISLPGIIAFMFYPGSFLFLFFAMLIAGILACLIEFLANYFCGLNLILNSLIAEVAAYRFMHFGFAPKQSYLLFGTLVLNILLFPIINIILGWSSSQFRKD